MVGRCFALAACVVLIVAGCGGEDDSGGDAAGDGGGLRAVTYNAGLAEGFVDLASERTPLVADALGVLEADVLAVQEIWLPEQVEAVADATAESLPNQVFLDPLPEEDPGLPSCTREELDPLQGCIETNCADVEGSDLVDCVLDSCGAEFGALPPPCQSCLGSNVGFPIDQVIENCTSSGGRYAYGASFGIGLLTNEEIVEQDTLVLESELNRRGIIYTLLDTDELGELHVFVTHLSAVFDDIPYPGEGTWEEEQAAQIDALGAFVDEKADDDRPVLLMGDFNTGPGGVDYIAEIPENYDALVATGAFENPYVAQPDARCTFCVANPLIEGEGEGGVVIDHVLVADFDGTVDVERLFDETIEVETEGETVTTARSDHYGVLATLTPE